MIHVVMDQLTFCLGNRLLDGVKLLGKVKAGSPLFEHRYDAPNMPLGPLEPLDDIRMIFMDACSWLHPFYPILWVGFRQELAAN